MKRRPPRVLTGCVAAALVLPLVASCAGDQTALVQPANQTAAVEPVNQDVFAARWPTDAGRPARPQPAVTASPSTKHAGALEPAQAKPPAKPPSAKVVLASVSPQASTANIEKPPSGIGEAKTELEHFATAPFPFSGNGVTLPSGRTLRSGRNYSDDRVLMHIPSGFDINQPAVMVVFFHGHRAELERDVLARQQVPAQISMSGMNAVLVAPQFAVNAADSNPGRFGERGGFARFLAESGKKLATLYGDPKKARQFETMPVVLVAYSGGYLPAAAVIENGGIGNRLRGVILLDALYGETNTFASWIKRSPKSFFISSYTSSTRRRNEDLAQALEEQNVRVSKTLDGKLWSSGRVTFLATDGEVSHNDFVTRAWTALPIKDVLDKLN